ncbi:nitrate transport atp-binding subunits c and d [Leptolyngbya sp. Heron Island J]|uniref:ATP-binding cassette domain-containing protein n=1 Tax=Leptolyngbya sp. Heron Island J TaxID=1385935 RepID=UPI0003B9F72E|nr:ATP-binding cassette domain-containing protein [Leptolyngbya sp. Heron Island J]ESA32054.1 nitrate transport atp-binding subunits c and d [Leptolyngbya sp. Heron Island J]
MAQLSTQATLSDPPVMDGLLQLENLSQVYSTHQGCYVALENINLSLQAGKFVGLIGYSSCGQSTLLNMVSGVNAPTEGSVTLRSQPITGPEPMVVLQNCVLPFERSRDRITADPLYDARRNQGLDFLYNRFVHDE